MASSACVRGVAQLFPDQLSARRLGGACSTSQAGCCTRASVDIAPPAHAGGRQSRRKVDLLRGQFGNGNLHTGVFEATIGIFRSAREQQRAEGSKVRCLLRGVGDHFWDGSERTPGGFAFTGRMPYRSVSQKTPLNRDFIPVGYHKVRGTDFWHVMFNYLVNALFATFGWSFMLEAFPE